MFARISRAVFLIAIVSLLIMSCGTEPTPAPTETSLPPTETTEPTATDKPAAQPKFGTDITISLPPGDPEQGSRLATTFFCLVCHGGVTGRGPTFASEEGMPPISARAGDRLNDPEYTGAATNDQEYLIESIVIPDIYIAPGEWVEHDYMGVDKFDEKLTTQNVADLIAWMTTIE